MTTGGCGVRCCCDGFVVDVIEVVLVFVAAVVLVVEYLFCFVRFGDVVVPVVVVVVE